MRTIDADALREAVESHVTSVSVCATAEQARGRTDFKKLCLKDIDEAPTVDAAPVRHGTWITRPNMYWRYVCTNDGSHTVWFNFLMPRGIINEKPGWFFEETEGWECSECGSAGYGRPAMMFEKPNFCPHCGAQMDGDENAAD